MIYSGKVALFFRACCYVFFGLLVPVDFALFCPLFPKTNGAAESVVEPNLGAEGASELNPVVPNTGIVLPNKGAAGVVVAVVVEVPNVGEREGVVKAVEVTEEPPNSGEVVVLPSDEKGENPVEGVKPKVLGGGGAGFSVLLSGKVGDAESGLPKMHGTVGAGEKMDLVGFPVVEGSPKSGGGEDTLSPVLSSDFLLSLPLEDGRSIGT